MITFRRAVLALTLAMPLAMAGAPAFAQDKDLVDTATANRDLATLVSAIKAAGLAETLKGKGPFTVFAPTDEAFKKLPAGTLEYLLKPENKAALESLVKFHVLPGSYDAARITKPTAKQFGIKSAEGQNVEVDLRKGVVISGATLGKSDIKASNGIIHSVDTVMVPRRVKFALALKMAKEKTAAATAKAKEMAAKAAEATKAAATKAGEVAKDAAAKATEAAKAAATKAKEAVSPTPPATAPATPAPKKP
jgi:uncharacterized surface protein with fasciclin (FAS1) repeats